MKPCSRCRVVAAIVRRSKILSIGFNSYSSTRLSRTFPKHSQAIFQHAEIAAIHNFLKEFSLAKLTNCDLWVCRAKLVGGEWTTGLALPCDGCQRAINHFKIKRVFYSVESK